MNISLYNLNKGQTNVLKAIAITLIVFHNFLHMVSIAGENEMGLDLDHIFRFLDIFSTFNKTSPFLFFRETASYIGWAGVPIFIFISGFGLTKAFLQKESSSYTKYLFSRLKKLYLLFAFGYLIFFVMLIISLGGDFNKYDYIRFVVLSLLVMPIKNYSFDIAYRYIGPGWYFCLAMQLYILFPLLFKYSKKQKLKGCIILLVVSYVIIYITTPIANKFGYPIYANFIGHLPEFIFGIMLAMYQKIRITWKIVLPTSIVFILANFYDVFFPFTFITFAILLLVITYPIYAWLSSSNVVYKALVFIGKISMFMFVINAPIRNLYTLRLADGHDVKEQVIISFIHYAIVVFASYLASLTYKKTGDGYNYMKNKIFAKKNNPA